MLNQETAKAARTDSGYILRAPRRMRVADAVAQYMRVPMGAGNSVPWDPLVAPYVIEPMNCLASREYDAVIFVGPARTGKTIGLIDGWVIYNVICDPADMLIIQMTEEKAREHSKKRLARTFRVSPEVVSRLSPNKNDNNVYDRTFLAGNYLKIGWPSVNIMSSSDYKCVALTDYDRFPEDIDGEGDAFSLASKRTTTFMSSGMTLVESSPGRDVKDVKWRRTSPHEAPPTTGILSLYNRGDRRRWYWPCPHCGEYFQPCGDVVAGFRDIADPVLASEAAYIQCPSCSGRILPEQKRELKDVGSGYGMVNPSMQMAVVMVIPGVHVLRHSGWRVRQLLIRHSRNSFTNCLLQNRNTRQPEVKRHSRRLSIPTGDYLIFPAPAWSNEKVNCLSSGQSQFLPAVCRMALISLWRQWMCRRDVIAVLWFR